MSLLATAESTSGPSASTDRGLIATLAITQTVSWGIVYYAFGAVLAPMRTDLGLTVTQATGAFSVGLLVSGAAALPVGRWIDRHGGRALMTSGSIAATVLVAAWSQVGSGLQLYLVWLGLGLAMAAILYEPAFAIIVRRLPEQRTQAIFAITLVAGFASTIFLPLTGALVDLIGWRETLFVLSVLLGVATIVPHALALRRDQPTIAKPAVHTDGRELAGTRPAFRALAVSMTCHTLATAVIGVHLVPLLVDKGYSTGAAGTIAGLLGALSVGGRLLTAGLTRRWPIRVVTAAVFTLQAMGVVVLVVAGSLVATVAGVLLFGIGFGVGAVARPLLLADVVPLQSYATMAALLVVPLTLAKATAPVGTALAADATGSLQAPLALVAVALAIAAVGVARMSRPSMATTGG